MGSRLLEFDHTQSSIKKFKMKTHFIILVAFLAVSTSARVIFEDSDFQQYKDTDTTIEPNPITSPAPEPTNTPKPDPITSPAPEPTTTQKPEPTPTTMPPTKPTDPTEPTDGPTT